MLDLQTSRRGRPGVDLAQFFWTSVTPQFRAKHLTDCLKIYSDTLTKNLKSLNCQEVIPKFADLQKELRECAIFGIILSLTHAQVCIAILISKSFYLQFLKF